MNRHFFTVVFVMGAMAVVWAGSGFIGTNHLALLMTVIIGMVYVFGSLELFRFRQATSTLSTALATIPGSLTNLDDWLVNVPSSLQNPVRMRIEGERIGLPGPSLTPYLVGLLVMLGMLGTFLGMVVTLNGAVFALEGTSDLQSIRSAFAAPIKGLGLAFGTSVAGVASSAMLGLMSALSRRERMLSAQLLDAKIGTIFRVFSLTHQRQETFKALQLQSQALPMVVDKLQAMMVQMERMSLQLNDRLMTNQESFHIDVKNVYTELAQSVDKSLRDSLTQSAHISGESLKPIVESAMARIAQEAKLMHERMIDSAQLQLDGISTRFSTTASIVVDTWTSALSSQERSNEILVTEVGQSLEAFNATFDKRSVALLVAVNDAYGKLQTDQASNDKQRLDAWLGSLEKMASELNLEWQQNGSKTLNQQQEICNTLAQTAHAITGQVQMIASQTLGEIARLVASSEELNRSRIASESDWVKEHSERMEQLSNMLRTELGSLRDEEALRGNAAVERLGQLQAALTSHLSTLGMALEDPITRLIETASDAPRAAAEVIGQLRKELTHSVARDNELLEERSRIMETLNSLLGAINQASVEQRAVIETMVASSSVALNHAGSEFSEKVGAEAAKLSEIAAHVTSSAVEVSSLSESFSFAVRSFSDANEKMIMNLQRIEGAMDKSMARSDDQMAYYVAQAREIIDLSIMSQKDIFEELRQLPSKQTLLTDEVN